MSTPTLEQIQAEIDAFTARLPLDLQVALQGERIWSALVAHERKLKLIAGPLARPIPPKTS